MALGSFKLSVHGKSNPKENDDPFGGNTNKRGGSRSKRAKRTHNDHIANATFAGTFNGAVREVQGRLMGVDLHGAADSLPPLSTQGRSRATSLASIPGEALESSFFGHAQRAMLTYESPHKLVEDQYTGQDDENDVSTPAANSVSVYSEQRARSFSNDPFVKSLSGRQHPPQSQHSVSTLGPENLPKALGSTLPSQDPPSAVRSSPYHSSYRSTLHSKDDSKDYALAATRSYINDRKKPPEISSSCSHKVPSSLASNQTKASRPEASIQVQKPEESIPSMLEIRKEFANSFESSSSSSTVGVSRQQTQLEDDIMSLTNASLSDIASYYMRSEANYDGEAENNACDQMDTDDRPITSHDVSLDLTVFQESSGRESMGSFRTGEDANMLERSNEYWREDSRRLDPRQLDVMTYSAVPRPLNLPGKVGGIVPWIGTKRSASGDNAFVEQQKTGLKRFPPVHPNFIRRSSVGYSGPEAGPRGLAAPQEHESDLASLKRDLNEARSKTQTFQTILQRTSQRFIDAQNENAELKRQLTDLREHQKLLQDALSTDQRRQSSSLDIDTELEGTMEENKALKKSIVELTKIFVARDEEVRVLVEELGRLAPRGAKGDEESGNMEASRDPSLAKLGEKWRLLRRWLLR